MNRRRRSSGNVVLLFALLVAVASARNCEKRQPSPSFRRTSSAPVTNPIEDVLRPVSPVQTREGIAAAVLIDTSGSMKEKVVDADGSPRPKIEIARRAAINLVNHFDSFARQHSDQVVFLGLYEFSQRRSGPPSRTVIKLGPPDPAAAQSAISKMVPEGDTPIGDAMIAAKRDLDLAGLSKRHMLVITDGENNRGYSPADVTQVIARQSASDRASIYFVAFDVAEAKFNSVRDAGGLVLAAANESDLKGTLDYLLTGKILVEQPPSR